MSTLACPITDSFALISQFRRFYCKSLTRRKVKVDYNRGGRWSRCSECCVDLPARVCLRSALPRLGPGERSVKDHNGEVFAAAHQLHAHFGGNSRKKKHQTPPIGPFCSPCLLELSFTRPVKIGAKRALRRVCEAGGESCCIDIPGASCFCDGASVKVMLNAVGG